MGLICPRKVEPIRRILDRIFIGCLWAACQLACANPLNFRYVINCTKDTGLCGPEGGALPPDKFTASVARRSRPHSTSNFLSFVEAFGTPKVRVEYRCLRTIGSFKGGESD
jgi:hypothetical protein